MFESIHAAPDDPIFGLTRMFREDSNPDKINLSIGVYQNDDGNTPELKCVSEAAKRLYEQPARRQYLPMTGLDRYNDLVAKLILGESHSAILEARAATIQTLGGTCALRVAADTLFTLFGKKAVWFTDPTWANHHHIFQSAGHEIRKFPWLDSSRTGLDFEKMLATLEAIPAGDVIVFHGCCHNPTGVDPTPDQWSQILAVIDKTQAFPIFDIAYQGFAKSIDDDAAAIRLFCDSGIDMMICNSFSKSMSLYNERVGGLTVCGRNRETTQNVLTNVKRCVRGNYSNPPKAGASLVAEVLGDDHLRSMWVTELAEIHDRIVNMRCSFSERMAELVPDKDFSFASAQRGMFSFTGLSPEQVEMLRVEHSIYLVGSGRINLAGLSSNNIDRVCQAIASLSGSPAK